MSCYPWRDRRHPEVAADYWNDHYPAGTAVFVSKDNGDVVETQTRGHAWVMGGHSAVCLADGISGAYALERFTPKCKKRVPA